MSDLKKSLKVRPVLICKDKSLTQQHFRETTNINKIMEKVQRTGIIPSNNLNPQYGDFSNGVDFHEALNRIQDAYEEFDGLPAKVKERFRQDPAEILDFLADDSNYNEAVELGLVESPEDYNKKVGEKLRELEKQIEEKKDNMNVEENPA